MKSKLPVIGWMFYDFANSAFATIVLAVIFNRYYSEVVAGGETGTTFHIPFLGVHTLPGSAIWSFLVAISTAFVALSSPLLGAIADFTKVRKRFLLFYCYVGVIGTFLLAFVNEGDVLLGAIFFIIANLGFAGGNVFYNSFLIDVSSRDQFGRISGFAWGLGYLGGGICLVLCLLMLKSPHLLGFPDGTFGVQDCMILAALWWGVFSLPTVFWLKDKTQDNQTKLSVRELTLMGWRRIVNTLRQIRKYKQLAKFLLSYLLFNDGIDTVIVMAGIFGAIVIGMSPADLVVFFILIQATALIGSFFFGWLSDITGNKASLMISLILWILVVVWAFFIGIFTDLRTEFYVIGIIAGIAMGGSQTNARSMQAVFTPDDKSAEFFGFWAISGRFASIFGTSLYGVAILVFGGVRPAILVIGVFFVAGAIVLATVDEEEGKRAVDVMRDNR